MDTAGNKKYLFFNRLAHICLCASLLVLFFSCDNIEPNPDAEFYNPDKIISYEVPEQYETLMCEKNLTDTSVVYSNIAIADGYLLLINNGLNITPEMPIFSVFDIDKDSMVSRFCHIGNAKNELNNVVSEIYVTKLSDSHLLNAQLSNGDTKRIHLEQSIQNNNSMVYDVVKSNVYESFCYYYILSKNKFFVNESFNSGDPRDNLLQTPRYYIMEKGEKTEYNLFPNIINNIERWSGDRIYSSANAITQDQLKIVSAPYYFDMLTIFDIKSGKTICLKEKNGYKYSDVNEEIKAKGAENLVDIVTLYNIALCTSEKFLFVLQDRIGHLYPKETSRTLLVFDWNGNLVETLLIEEPIKQIAYDEQRQRLYGSDLAGMLLLRYDLSKYLK